jgi:hypothetical protein
LTALRIQSKREELIGQLNAHKKSKKTDAFIQTEMKNQTAAIATQIKSVKNEEATMA